MITLRLKSREGRKKQVFSKLASCLCCYFTEDFYLVWQKDFILPLLLHYMFINYNLILTEVHLGLCVSSYLIGVTYTVDCTNLFMLDVVRAVIQYSMQQQSPTPVILLNFAHQASLKFLQELTLKNENDR